MTPGGRRGLAWASVLLCKPPARGSSERPPPPAFKVLPGKRTLWSDVAFSSRLLRTWVCVFKALRRPAGRTLSRFVNRRRNKFWEKACWGRKPTVPPLPRPGLLPGSLGSAPRCFLGRPGLRAPWWPWPERAEPTLGHMATAGRDLNSEPGTHRGPQPAWLIHVARPGSPPTPSQGSSVISFEPTGHPPGERAVTAGGDAVSRWVTLGRSLTSTSQGQGHLPWSLNLFFFSLRNYFHLLQHKNLPFDCYLKFKIG